MKVLASLLLLAAFCSAVPLPDAEHHDEEHHHEAECNPALAIKATARCWAFSTPGSWLLDEDRLDLKDIFISTDWEELLKDGFDKVNLENALKELVEEKGGYESVALAFGLLAGDGNGDSDEAKEVRDMMCKALWELKRCAEDNANSCATQFDTLVQQDLNEMLFANSINFPVEPNSEQLRTLLQKNLCFLCDNHGAAIDVLFNTFLDADKLEAAQEFKQDSKRSEVYSSCEFEDPTRPDIVTVDYVIGLSKDKPCVTAQYLRCLANAVHSTVNPEVSLNVAGTLVDITQEHLFQCPGVSLPQSVQQCQVPEAAYLSDECNPVQSFDYMMKCFAASEGGTWLINDVMEVSECIANADWNDFLRHAIYEGDVETALKHLLHEQMESAAVGLTFAADDASQTDEAGAEARANMCNALRSLKTCAAFHMRGCADRADNAITEVLSAKLAERLINLPIQEEINVRSVSVILDRQICYICQDNGAGMQLLLETLYDEERKAIVSSYMETEKRLETYAQCDIPDPNRPDPVTVEYMASLMTDDQQCTAYEYAACLMKTLHNDANPDRENVALGLVNIAFIELYNCNAPSPIDEEECGISPINSGECQPVEQTDDLVQCWMQTDGGMWFLEQMGVGDSLEDANWRDFYVEALHNKNSKGALNILLQESGGIEAVGLALVLVLDDSLYADNKAEVRGNLCQSLNDLMQCAAMHLDTCIPVLDLLLEADFRRFLEDEDAKLPAQIKVGNIARGIEGNICYMCQDEEAYELIVSTLLDKQKLEKIAELRTAESRLAIYNTCDVADSPLVKGSITKEDLAEYGMQSACNLFPYIRCYADHMHNSLNPGSPTSAAGWSTNILFSTAFDCPGIEVPESIQNCPVYF